MAAQDLYVSLHQAISDHLDQDDALSTFELLGVLRLVSAELEAIAMDEEEAETQS